MKEFKGRQNCDSSSKQTTLSLCVNKLTSPKILMSKLIPPNLLFTFLRLRLGYKSAVVAINSTSWEAPVLGSDKFEDVVGLAVDGFK